MESVHHVVQSAMARPVLVVALTIAFTLIAQFSVRLYRQRRFFKGLPGPPHSFLWGHLKEMGDIAANFPPHNHPQTYFTAIARKYNLEGIFYLDLWPLGPSQVVLSDPQLLDAVTVVKPYGQHHATEDFIAPITGRNVIASVNGPIWKKLHGALLPAFSWSHIRSATDTIVDECLLFRQALEERAASGVVFSLEELGAKLIFDVIARLVFNVRLNAQTTGSVYLDDLREMIHLAEGLSDISLAFNPVAMIKVWWKRRQVLGRLHPSILNKIEERLDLLHGDGIVPSRKDPTSILDLMLREHIENEKKSEDPTAAWKPLSAFDKELLVNNIKGLLLGGHGTTNDSLCYIYMLLSKSPEVVAKVQQEHTAVFGDSFDVTVQKLLESPQDLQSLPYTEAVIKETLRLFPIGFGLRAASAGETLSFNGQTFPIDNDLAITLNGHDLHYNPQYFPEPTVFRPERWLDPENEIPRSYFRAFSRGMRACLGQNMAMNELKIILVMTIRDYEISCANLKPNSEPRTSHTDLDTVYGDIVFQQLALEAKPRGGMEVTVKKRYAY